jgi:prolipoprotein diacylglyceryltransferase
MYDPEHAFSTGIFTPGIVYSIPMILIGAYVIWRARKNATAA